jgi:hypothetical protein
MQATIVMMAAGQPMQKISPAIVDPTIIPIPIAELPDSACIKQ